MATNLKLQLGDDIRRLNISQLTTYAEFSALVRSVFNIPALNGIQMAYQDEDKDWINIRSEMDMAEARAYAARFPSFKINVVINNGVSQSPVPNEPSYPQLAPEDIDLTSSFADLMTDSMQMEKKTESPLEAPQAQFVLPIPGLPSNSIPLGQAPGQSSQSTSDQPESSNQIEADFHKSLDELSAAHEKDTEAGIGVLTTVEGKIKKALDALVEFMESLKLDDKMKRLVVELEPSFAKFEATVLQPLENLSQRASRGIQTEIQEFQVQVNEFKDRLQQRLEEIRSRPASPAQPRAKAQPSSALEQASPVVVPSAPVAASSSPISDHHSAMMDLQTLETMGFTDRRRNLELLATHKGNLGLVIDSLLADAQ